MDKTTRMRSNGRLSKFEVERLHRKVDALEEKIAKMEAQKNDYLFEIGRALIGKKVYPECKKEDALVQCQDCNCWKSTRNQVS